jgi:hypothetical protein
MRFVNFLYKCRPIRPITLNKHQRRDYDGKINSRFKLKAQKTIQKGAPLLPSTSPIVSRLLLGHLNSANAAGNREMAHVHDWHCMAGKVDWEPQAI